ncbi:MAG: hypothetical protein GX922_01910 [Firmicutes bacterium]|nr:hypothetical protein [Bacillota bacterium]
MRKVGILVVVCLLVATGIMAAMAYTTASVESDMSVKLTRNANALLALKASGIHNASYFETRKNYTDVLEIDLSKGYNNETFGVQDNSAYCWEDLFGVKNNSENRVKVSITLNPNVQGRIHIHGRLGKGDNWTRISSVHDKHPGSALVFFLDPGAEEWIDLKTTAMNGHLATYNWKLIVDAVAVQPENPL